MHKHSTLLTFGLLVVGCGSSDLGMYDAELNGQMGRVAIGLSRSEFHSPAKHGLAEIIVHLREVRVHSSGGGWKTIMKEPKTIDILKLADEAQALGFADLLAEQDVTQVRLVLSETDPSHVTTEDGTQYPLKVPSGVQSGIKVKGLWRVERCMVSSIDLSFDHEKSIHVHPTGDKERYILRPVIKAKKGTSLEAENCGPSDEPLPPSETSEPPTSSDPSFDPESGYDAGSEVPGPPDV